MALYIGGMGAKDKNFYTDYATRLGFGDAARKVQELYLAGKQGRKRQAAVPDALVDACHLVGPPARIRDRLQRWVAAGKKGHVGSMLIRSPSAQGAGAAGGDCAVGWACRLGQGGAVTQHLRWTCKSVGLRLDRRRGITIDVSGHANPTYTWELHMGAFLPERDP